jgi:biopolymer transport protein ExbB
MLHRLHTIPAAVLIILAASASPGLAAPATPAVAAGPTATAELPAAPASAGSAAISAQKSSSAPAPAAAAPPVSPVAGALGLLEDNLSPWSMFLNADLVVKAVICGLVFAILATWTIFLAKSLELAMARRRLRDSFRYLREASSLGQATENLGEGNGVARAMVRAAQDEWRRSADALDDRDGLKERISLYLQRVEAATGRRMMIGTGVIATIGATAPFVGLFGTVWGIMSSFVGIARLHTSNLSAVAPGIAEALLATAIGLLAAIPAVVIYNHFARQISAFKAQVADAGAAVMRLASRDLSRGLGHDAPRLAAE